MYENHPLGDYLKELRKDRKVSQEKMADLLGISRQAYSHYELGKCMPPMDILGKIADFYRISVEKLYRNGAGIVAGVGLSAFEQNVISAFGLLNEANQKEIYELILFKLQRAMLIFMC